MLGGRAREIDFDKRVWTIPAGRPGLKRPGDFRVPLSDDAIAVLQAVGVDPLGYPDRYLFPGTKPHKPLTNILKYLKDDMRKSAYTVHGFRFYVSGLGRRLHRFCPRPCRDVAGPYLAGQDRGGVSTSGCPSEATHADGCLGRLLRRSGTCR